MKTGLPNGWVTISDFARERGVDKGGLSRKCAKLEALGRLEIREFGRAKIINRAAFDRAALEQPTLGREAAGRAAVDRPTEDSEPSGAALVLSQEQAKRTSYEAKLKRLDLQERLGRLVDVGEVRLNIEACALDLSRTIDELPTRAESLATALTKGGVTGVRAALRDLARELRETLARAADRFAEEALAQEEEAT